MNQDWSNVKMNLEIACHKNTVNYNNIRRFSLINKLYRRHTLSYWPIQRQIVNINISKSFISLLYTQNITKDDYECNNFILYNKMNLEKGNSVNDGLLSTDQKFETFFSIIHHGLQFNLNFSLRTVSTSMG